MWDIMIARDPSGMGVVVRSESQELTSKQLWRVRVFIQMIASMRVSLGLSDEEALAALGLVQKRIAEGGGWTMGDVISAFQYAVEAGASRDS